jgi:hypothetical protein
MAGITAVEGGLAFLMIAEGNERLRVRQRFR